ncbi:MAG: hypothetical protein ACFBSE_13770 [Prochloraceae cyanobacterium]
MLDKATIARMKIIEATFNKKEMSQKEWDDIAQYLSKEDIENILKAVAKKISKAQM